MNNDTTVTSNDESRKKLTNNEVANTNIQKVFDILNTNYEFVIFFAVEVSEKCVESVKTER